MRQGVGWLPGVARQCYSGRGKALVAWVGGKDL